MRIFTFIFLSIVCLGCAEPEIESEKIMSKHEELLRFSYREGKLAKPILLGSAPIYVKEAIAQIKTDECGEALLILQQLQEAAQ